MFYEEAKIIQEKHKKQSSQLVIDLNNKYKNNFIYNPRNLWEFIEGLKHVVDPTDKQLMYTNQFIHTMQVVEHIKDEELLVVGLIHDLGKLLLLTDEKPENIVCENWVILGKPKAGLDNCICNWNHDEFAYMRFKDKLPYHMSWLIRYHSLKLPDNTIYMSEKDLQLSDKYLQDFRKFDRRTKCDKEPKIDYDKYIKIIEKWFPEPITL